MAHKTYRATGIDRREQDRLAQGDLDAPPTHQEKKKSATVKLPEKGAKLLMKNVVEASGMPPSLAAERNDWIIAADLAEPTRLVDATALGDMLQDHFGLRHG